MQAKHFERKITMGNSKSVKKGVAVVTAVIVAVVMVRVTGLEPAHRLTLEPKSSASANSATPAFLIFARPTVR